MAVKKRKQSEVVYTYYPTTTQIFMCKEMFLMRCDYSNCRFSFIICSTNYYIDKSFQLFERMENS